MKHELREHPKIKSFIRGGYRYNPVIDKDALKIHAGIRSEATASIANPAYHKNPRNLPRLISMRARHARIEAQWRRRLLRGK